MVFGQTTAWQGFMHWSLLVKGSNRETIPFIFLSGVSRDLILLFSVSYVRPNNY